jgi:acyl-CoA synthetase (AMP-forming)/AMP-acid ligase II
MDEFIGMSSNFSIFSASTLIPTQVPESCPDDIEAPADNPFFQTICSKPDHPCYMIFTSGTTGLPKVQLLYLLLTFSRGL